MIKGLGYKYIDHLTNEAVYDKKLKKTNKQQ